MATLAQVLEAFGLVYGASPVVARTTIRSRVQALQRLGIPKETGVGTGQRVDYDAEEICKIALCFEMSELGIPPSQQQLFLRDHWPNVGKLFLTEWKKPLGVKDASGVAKITAPTEYVRLVISSAIMSHIWHIEDAQAFRYLQWKMAEPRTEEARDKRMAELVVKIQKQKLEASAVEIVKIAKSDSDLAEAVKVAEASASHCAVINISLVVFRLRGALVFLG